MGAKKGSTGSLGETVTVNLPTRHAQDLLIALSNALGGGGGKKSDAKGAKATAKGGKATAKGGRAMAKGGRATAKPKSKY